MSNSKTKTSNRILALLLSLIMIIGIVPIKVYASTPSIPNAFTFTVKDNSSNAISDANISYDIKVNGVSAKTNSTITNANGEVEITDMQDYADKIASGSDNVAISYTVSKNGFTSVSDNYNVNDINANISVTLNKVAPDTVSITVNAAGTGTGKVMLNSKVTNTATVQKNSDVTLAISPDDGCCIKDITINGIGKNVGNGKSYNETLKVTENTVINVTYSRYYTITISKNIGGAVKFDGNDVASSASFEKGKSTELTVVPDSGYQIESVSIAGKPQIITPTNFSVTLSFYADVQISVSFVKVYTITVTHNENGTVVTDPVCSGGKVTVNTGNNVLLTATPLNTYRVSKVVIGGAPTDYDDNKFDNANPYTTSLKADKDYTVEITFAPLVYKITTAACTNGTVTPDSAKVDYNSDTSVRIAPADGYEIDTIKVNGTVVGGPISENEDGSLKLSIADVKEDKNIAVTFKLSETTVLADVGFNVSDAVRTDTDKKLFVFEKDAIVAFTTTKQGMRITYSDGSIGGGILTNKIDITSSKTIKRIQLRYGFAWHDVNLESSTGQMKIVIDDCEPRITPNILSKDSNGFYNSDVNFDIIANDDGDYSGIESIKYTVTCDNVKTQDETLYSYKDGDKILNQHENNFTIAAQNNNSDNVKALITVTDLAGNVKEYSCDLKINITKPTINVSLDGILQSEAKPGCYNNTRHATITIVDRNSCFNESEANNGIPITAKDANGNNIAVSKPARLSSWSTIGDTHTATLTFSADANYNWNIYYRNNANLAAEAAVTEGDNPFIFAVDKTAPTGSVTMDGGVWNNLLSSVTFGFYRNYKVTAEVFGVDATTAIKDIKYYKDNGDAALTQAQLDELYNAGKFVKDKYSVDADEAFVIYARITDNAGNSSYISSSGAIVDKTQSSITLTPDAPNKSGFYNKDFNVKVDVNDEIALGTAFSGIKSVDFKVIKDNDENNPTQTGNLYTNKINNPTKSQLTDSVSEYINVNANLNNSDNVKVVVTATDNAGNTFVKETEQLAINTSHPEISVKFDNNTPNKISESGNGYFGSTRTATVEIKDRASAFNKDNATQGISIAAVDSKGNAVTLNKSAMISSWVTNGDIHTATIKFAGDANYTWSMTYTNLADNDNQAVKADGCTTPFTFAVDTNNPTGTVSVNQNVWDKILNVITFGIYTNTKLDINATSADATSPTSIEYFKTNNPKALTADELDAESFSAFNRFSVNSDEQFTVYLKIKDFAGNYTYVSSNGCIVDQKSSIISETVETKPTNNIYNQKVKVNVKVDDAEPYSGIKSVDYWVVKDNDNANPTQSGNLFTFNIANPTQADLKNSWSGDVTIDSALNNSCNVTLYVKTIDNAGNENTKSVPLDIDATAPAISVSYDNNKDNNGNGYFKAARTATVTIKERSHHFEPDKATDGIKITAVDAKGNAVDNAYTISGWTTTEGTTPDEATHTAKISFNKDANYNFSVAYTDKAGNVNTPVTTGSSAAPFKFTVDSAAPSGTVKAASAEGRVSEWSTINDSLTFGYWSKAKITLSAVNDDATSPVDSVKYIKVSADKATTALTAADLDKATGWEDFNGFDVTNDEQFVVYLRITDKAGNYSYVGTDGLIVDEKAPDETIAPEITINPEQPVNGIYNKDVKVNLNIEDPLAGGTYSGLKTVSYKVLCDGETTQSGTLYSFNTANPKNSDLKKLWTGDITVDSSKNNSNNVVIEVFAEDNSLNSAKERKTIKIDTTNPTIDIFYNNNNADSGTFFKEARTATIVVGERNFNPKDVKINITNKDGSVPRISDWSETSGSGNLDNTKWTATLTYTADGDYNFDIAYTDLAGNKCSGAKFAANTVAGSNFTIDKTKPVINVTYDNNSPSNGNYYKASRTATVVINEHNFDASRVSAVITASDDGANKAAPVISGWSSSGDRHTATLSYSSDAMYTFEISFKDKAGNAAAKFEKQTFYVDKTMPELSISGVVENSANKGDVKPVVSYKDTNFDGNNVTITLTGANRGAVKLDGANSDTHNGRTFTFDNFPKTKDMDDIYTLTARLTDKAGNTTTKTINFSVNRFGSTYALSGVSDKLNGSFVKNADDVVITETNANECKNIKVTLFKNDKTINLENNKDYKVDVEGGNGQWYKYTYTIFKKNFVDDGIYRILIHSEDAAGNVAENGLESKDKEISFGVDKTKPNIVVTNLDSDKTYPVDNLSVVMSASDNLKLASVVVSLDGKEYKSWNEEDLQKLVSKKADLTFTITGTSTAAHSVRIVSKDAAGNENVNEIKNFFVTTNILVRYYTNKILFFGSIGGVLLLAGGLTVLIVLKKKKKATD